MGPWQNNPQQPQFLSSYIFHTHSPFQSGFGFSFFLIADHIHIYIFFWGCINYIKWMLWNSCNFLFNIILYCCQWYMIRIIEWYILNEMNWASGLCIMMGKMNKMQHLSLKCLQIYNIHTTTTNKQWRSEI